MTSKNTSTEVQVLEHAVQVMTTALNNLISECLTETGQPKAPSRQSINKARGLLPASYSNTFATKPSESEPPP